MSEAALSGLILAGGLSSRMGQDKAELRWQGQTLLHHTVTLAQQAGCDDIQISRNKAGGIQDNFPRQGPLAGLEAALPYCHHPRVLLLCIDMPLLLPGTLQPLLHSTTSAHFAGQPFPALLAPAPGISRAALTRLLSAELSQPDGLRSVSALWQQLGLRELPPPAEPLMLNSNTPSGWLQAQAALAARSVQ